MTARTVGIVDYGVGNLRSLKGALETVGWRVAIGKRPEAFENISALLLPGVGSAAFAMQALNDNGMVPFIRERFEREDVPIIGVCLGMQLMYDWSEEGDTTCLGLIPGRTLVFPGHDCHVGWNIVEPVAGNPGAPAASHAYYFNHSFRVETPPETLAGRARYGNVEVSAMVRARRFTGVQFHPEKSQLVGRALLADLLENG